MNKYNNPTLIEAGLLQCVREIAHIRERKWRLDRSRLLLRGFRWWRAPFAALVVSCGVFLDALFVIFIRVPARRRTVHFTGTFFISTVDQAISFIVRNTEHGGRAQNRDRNKDTKYSHNYTPYKIGRFSAKQPYSASVLSVWSVSQVLRNCGLPGQDQSFCCEDPFAH
jgi:hypothetical protein